MLDTERLAVRVPIAEGVKVTVMEHAVEGARVAGLEGQVFVAMAKSPEFAPVRENPLKVTAALPVLEIETPCAALVVLRFCAAKVRLETLDDRVIVTTFPVPVRDTDCGLPVASSVKTTLAVRTPLAVGVNVT